jgi:hypothetical protein
MLKQLLKPSKPPATQAARPLGKISGFRRNTRELSDEPGHIFALPAGFWIAAVALVTITAGLVFYALYCKGDVSAEFTHGLTTFRLEAKDRAPGKRDRG